MHYDILKKKNLKRPWPALKQFWPILKQSWPALYAKKGA